MSEAEKMEPIGGVGPWRDENTVLPLRVPIAYGIKAAMAAVHENAKAKGCA